MEQLFRAEDNSQGGAFPEADNSQGETFQAEDNDPGEAFRTEEKLPEVREEPVSWEDPVPQSPEPSAPESCEPEAERDYGRMADASMEQAQRQIEELLRNLEKM